MYARMPDLRDEYLAEGHGEEATAEFDRVDTIDAIAAGLVELGHQVDRIGRAGGQRTAWRLGIAGIWCSTSAKGSKEVARQVQGRRSGRFSSIPDRIHSSCHCACTKAWRSWWSSGQGCQHPSRC